MGIKRCTRCKKKAHYLRGFPNPGKRQEYHTSPTGKFCTPCYEEVSIELCMEVDETMMRYAMG